MAAMKNPRQFSKDFWDSVNPHYQSYHCHCIRWATLTGRMPYSFVEEPMELMSKVCKLFFNYAGLIDLIVFYRSLLSYEF